MKLIIGLGNPGKKYAHTRHNVGHMAIDTLRKTKLSNNVIAKKTGVFMNTSGEEIKSLTTHYKLQATDLYIIHDDLDLRLGEYKINKGKGPKDHKGLTSIYQHLGTKDFWHVRVGVDNRKSENRTPGEEYVLEPFTSNEKEIINQVIKNIINELPH